MYKHKKTFYPLRYLAPDFKTYISGIVLQFPTIWLEKNDVFFDLTGLQDRAVVKEYSFFLYK